jgi:hypothetical protein
MMKAAQSGECSVAAEVGSRTGELEIIIGGESIQKLGKYSAVVNSEL